jgi:flagellar assembly protein FliH
VSDIVRPFRFVSFEEEARTLVEAARVQAQDLLQTAVREKARVLEEARRDGYRKGFEEARAAVAVEERQRVEGEVAALAGVLRAAADGVESRRSELVTAAERDLVRLALAVAERIVKGEVASGRNVAAANVRRAVELAARRHELRVLLNPADLALVEGCVPALRREFADIGTLSLEAAESVTRGGCVVVTREGAVDADIATQLDEIERGLLG